MRRLLVTCLFVMTLVGACSNGDESDPDAAADDRPSGSAPYLLLDAEGWDLEGGMEGGPMGMVRSAAYVSTPDPNTSVGASIAVFTATRPRDLAAQLGEPKDVRIGDADGVGLIEHNTPDNTPIVAHVLWIVDGYTAWLTAYDPDLDKAVALAQNVKTVPADEWQAAVDKATADHGP